MDTSRITVNELLINKITKVSNTLRLPHFKGDIRELRFLEDCLTKKIDVLGDQSAKSQGLNKIITTGHKLRNSEHIVYLLKDASANSGKGEVIGLLKIGFKDLYLSDGQNRPWKGTPLCLLDFYVMDNYQHHGYGKLLLDHMMKDQNISSPEEFAIDGPSPKLVSFFKKYFGIQDLVRHSNNYSVMPGFFCRDKERSGRCTPSSSTNQVIGRYAAQKPRSEIMKVIHGYNGDSESTSKNGVDENERNNVNIHEYIVQNEAQVESDVNEPVVVEVVKEQRNNERPSSLDIGPMTTNEADLAKPTPAGSSSERRLSSVTDRGYFDVKFYHNKLW